MPQIEEFVTPIAERLPDGSIPEFCIYVVGFLRADGTRCKRWMYDGDASFDTLVTALEMAKLSWMTEQLEEAQAIEEEDD